MANKDQIGVLWAKVSSKGQWFSGNLELKPEDIKDGKINIVIFSNRDKVGDSGQPDFHILKSRPKSEVPEQKHGPVDNEDVPF